MASMPPVPRRGDTALSRCQLMRRLLTATAAAAVLLVMSAPSSAAPKGKAQPVSTDIVVSTDLDEKYVIKQSAVTITPYTKGDYRNIPYVKPESVQIVESAAFDILFLKISYRPIFVDLNGQKKALDYIHVACVNPKMDGTLMEAVNYGTSIRRFSGTENPFGYPSMPLQGSTLAKEIVKAKVCEKYAKF